MFLIKYINNQIISLKDDTLSIQLFESSKIEEVAVFYIWML